ncbi:hypothetical protein IMG5_063860 [Ichthyophthirius multifiliis]|uniref:Uncharacterized protein n=1 Tax=Ichthyophthirius multifiliis TaxID=5932 RepID=G0QP48_ICHMU|nr:hypothetical protein IMG5_063860 [Ichthyophthirius multifiliis]EGR33014.1 hypothetical protein IMG5_063860 [Ichthyophthirius multifiliis]|eukprot:XP_004037000.1 hypothetical protein IMG5_063860 [Ichthyophthirius multifiliis]
MKFQKQQTDKKTIQSILKKLQKIEFLHFKILILNQKTIIHLLIKIQKNINIKLWIYKNNYQKQNKNMSKKIKEKLNFQRIRKDLSKILTKLLFHSLIFQKKYLFQISINLFLKDQMLKFHNFKIKIIQKYNQFKKTHIQTKTINKLIQKNYFFLKRLIF